MRRGRRNVPVDQESDNAVVTATTHDRRRSSPADSESDAPPCPWSALDTVGMSSAPRQRERPEVHLALPTRRCLEAHRRRHRLSRTHAPHVVPYPSVAAFVSRRPHFVEQPLRRQPRERCQSRLDDPLVRIRLVRRSRSRRILRSTPARSRSNWPVSIQWWIVRPDSASAASSFPIHTSCSAPPPLVSPTARNALHHFENQPSVQFSIVTNSFDECGFLHKGVATPAGQPPPIRGLPAASAFSS